MNDHAIIFLNAYRNGFMINLNLIVPDHNVVYSFCTYITSANKLNFHFRNCLCMHVAEVMRVTKSRLGHSLFLSILVSTFYFFSVFDLFSISITSFSWMTETYPSRAQMHIAQPYISALFIQLWLGFSVAENKILVFFWWNWERCPIVISFHLLYSSTDESQRDFSFGHASHSQRRSLHNPVSFDRTTRVRM